MQNLNFAALNKAAGYETWCDTFAYWLGVLYKPETLFAQNAEEAHNVMSYQFDVEEQAQNEEMLIGYAEIIPSIFKPIAPVTVAFRWSPFPLAIEKLGQPIHLDTHKGYVLTVFEPILDFDATASTLDEQHFVFLLKHACRLALEANSSILLTGAPGWTYEEMGSMDEDVRKLMQGFGFVYTLRQPLTS